MVQADKNKCFSKQEVVSLGVFNMCMLMKCFEKKKMKRKTWLSKLGFVY